MNRTPIEWTDYSSNPFKARHKAIANPLFKCPKCGTKIHQQQRHGSTFNLCTKISPGCAHCYAATLTHRWGGPDYLSRSLECFEPVLVEKELQAILKSKASGVKVFAFDMTDAFLDFWPDEFLDKFFAVAALRPDLTFQILTKRAERLSSYMNSPGNGPFPNVWLGVSVEDQKNADERIPWLLKTPAAVRFVSYEPALGPVNFKQALCGLRRVPITRSDEDPYTDAPKIDWLIFGFESGPHARPGDVQWIRDGIAQCRAAGVPAFVKQLGSKPVDFDPDHEWFESKTKQFHTGGRTYLKLKDKKGGDISEWTEDLRVREFPEVAR